MQFSQYYLISQITYTKYNETSCLILIIFLRFDSSNENDFLWFRTESIRYEKKNVCNKKCSNRIDDIV